VDRFLKFLKSFFVGLLLTLIIVIGSAYIARNHLIKSYFIHMFEKNMGYQIKIEGLNWHPLQGAFTLNHVTIYNKPQYRAPAMMRIVNMFFTVDLLKAVFDKKYEFGLLEIELRTINIVKYQDEFNYIDFQRKFYEAVDMLQPFQLGEYVVKFGTGTLSDDVHGKRRSNKFEMGGITEITWGITDPDEIYNIVYRRVYANQAFSKLKRKFGLPYISPIREPLRAAVNMILD